MRRHGGTPSRRDKHVTLAAISPPSVAWGLLVGGQQSGLAGCKPPPLFMRGASSCSSQGRRQGEPWGASPRPSAPTHLPTSDFGDVCACIPLACTSSPCNPVFLNLGTRGWELYVSHTSYVPVQATVGVGTVLIWDFGVALTRRGGTCDVCCHTVLWDNGSTG